MIWINGFTRLRAPNEEDSPGVTGHSWLEANGKLSGMEQGKDFPAPVFLSLTCEERLGCYGMLPGGRRMN